jgi:DNA polymerase I-like protein with 3'-5' exonuclease and polymerase domains
LFEDKEESKEEEKKIKDENREDIEKAKIAFWLLNSERTNPDIDEVIHYNGSRDFDEALSKLESDIDKEGLTYVYKKIEVPIIPIIKEMEDNGILVDKEYFKRPCEKHNKKPNHGRRKNKAGGLRRDKRRHPKRFIRTSEKHYKKDF